MENFKSISYTPFDLKTRLGYLRNNKLINKIVAIEKQFDKIHERQDLTDKEKSAHIGSQAKLETGITGYLWLKFLYMLEKDQTFINYDDEEEKQ